MRKLMRLCVTAMAVCMLLSGAALASHDSADIDAIWAELETNRRVVVAENMSLSEASSAAFWNVYDEYRAEMGALEKQGLLLLREFHEHFEEVTDGRANQIMAAYFSHATKILKLREKYVPEFNRALSAKQTLRLYQIENKLDAIIQADISSVTPLVPE